jgi:isoleucyl-tRNA synthetase
VNPDAVAKHGSTLRWYMITTSNPRVPKRYDPVGVEEAYWRFFDTVFNTYRFSRALCGRRWSRPRRTCPPSAGTSTGGCLRLSPVVARGEELDGYQVTRAYRALGDFVSDGSNWYAPQQAVSGGNGDAWTVSGFCTLRDALAVVSRLMAPLTPFTADWLSGSDRSKRPPQSSSAEEVPRDEARGRDVAARAGVARERARGEDPCAPATALCTR